MTSNNRRLPGQEHDHDDLSALLVAALDSPDQRRAALVMALYLAKLDGDRDADIARLRLDGPPPVRPF